ncbi:peroxisomal biogenesis factor 19-like [Musca vetustissima]|uniref:peroxisomal biogenesis factor 19-like n=1 Tax=Musca vetustissima TaxID=27455 RepID=UPI002AB6531C|nr:peroxisomal biogenesis factor 19-like [Musca vetustissima]
MADQQKPNDNDLNELLDNALQDFVKDDKQTANGDGSNAAQDGAEGNPESEEFFLEQAKLLAERMNTLFGGPDTPTGDVAPLPQDPEQIMAGFKKMAEAAAKTLQGENTASDEEVAKYSDSIAQALKGLQEGTDNLTAPVSENDVANMFGGLSLDSAASDDGNMFLPFMEGMMQSLLSAEILLPSIKELLEKYPKYLEENGSKISAEDKERYEKQLELYKIIEGHLENENPNDTAKEKRDKFRVVLEDMRKLQEYGQPPEEILAETAGDLPVLDPAAAGAAAGNPQCPMM